jgi:hypothetical protein
VIMGGLFGHFAFFWNGVCCARRYNPQFPRP